MLRWQRATDKDAPSPEAGDKLALGTSAALAITVVMWFAAQAPDADPLSFILNNAEQLLPVPVLMTVPPLAFALYKFASAGLYARRNAPAGGSGSLGAVFGFLVSLIGLAGSVATLITFFGLRRR